MEKLSRETILKHLPIKYFVIDAKSFKIIESNDPEIKMGRFCYQEIYQLDQACYESGLDCICQQITKNNILKSISHHLVKGGELLSFELNSAPIYNDRQELTHVIIERLSTHQTSNSSESENSDIISVLSPEGNILFTNKNAEIRFNKEPEDIIGKNISDFVTDEQAKKLKSMFLEILKSKQAIQQELPIHFKDKVKWFSNKMETIRFGSNLKWAILSTSKDISNQISSKNIQKQSENSFKMIAESIHDVIWKLDLQTFRYSYISPSIFQLRGLTPKEAMQESLEDSLHPDDYTNISQILAHTIDEYSKGAIIKMNNRFEVRQFRKDKSMIWVEITASIILDENNKPIEILGVSRDITAKQSYKRKLEEGLERERFFGDILRNSSQAIIIAFPDGTLASLNKSAQHLFGYTDSEMQSLNWISGLTPEKWRNKEKELLANAVKKNTSITYKKEFIHKNGQYISVELLVHPKLDPQGNIQHYIIFITDISEIQKTQQLLTESKERFKYALMGANDGLWDWNMLNSELYMSPRYLEILGYNSTDIKQHFDSFLELIHPDDVKHVFVTHDEYLNDEIVRFEAQFRMKHKKGHWVPILSRSYKITDESGQAVRLVGTHIDLTEIKNIQETLRESEEKYKILFENANVGVAITSLDGSLINANHQLLDYMGLPYDGYKGTNIKAHYAYESDREVFLEQIIKKGELTNYHFQFRSLNGNIRWVSSSSKMVMINDEKRFITVVTDIDRQIKAEQRLKESEERFKHFSKLTNEGILIHDKGKTVDINQSLLKLLGYKRNEVMGKNIIDMCSTERSRPIFYDHININSTKSYEAEILTKKGKVIQVEVRSKTSKYNSKPIRVTTILDITQHKKDRLEIDDMSKRLSLAIRAASFGIWELNLQTQELYWDENLHKIYELDIHDKQDKYNYFKKAVIPKDWRKLMYAIGYGIKHETLIDEEFSIIINGKSKHLKAFVQVAPSADNKYKRLIGVTYDISSQKHFEAEIIRERKKALESDQLKSAFLANMSHEIRTPLNGIIGFTELLREVDSDYTHDEKNQYLEIISNNGQMLLLLVNDIIDLSKIETGQLHINLQKIKLQDILKKIIKTFEPQIVQKGLKLQYDSSSTDICLNTDFTRLAQILNNLIGNALKFTAKGYIKINYQENDQFVLFSIEDSGIGISQDAQKIVFNRFAQGRPVRDQLLGGTGLGLSITKGLVKLLGGKIWMESEEGKGSIFYFTIQKW